MVFTLFWLLIGILVINTMWGKISDARKERLDLIGLCAGLVLDNRHEYEDWRIKLARHERLKDDSSYLLGFNNDKDAMLRQVQLMREVMILVELGMGQGLSSSK